MNKLLVFIIGGECAFFSSRIWHFISAILLFIKNLVGNFENSQPLKLATARQSSHLNRIKCSSTVPPHFL